MNNIAQILMFAGGLIFLAGLFYFGLSKFGITKISGDFLWKKGDVTFAFPLATSIILSIIATIVINIFFRR